MFSSTSGFSESVNTAVDPLGVNVSTDISAVPSTFTKVEICTKSPAFAPFTRTTDVVVFAV